jgi:hypothetical protein
LDQLFGKTAFWGISNNKEKILYFRDFNFKKTSREKSKEDSYAHIHTHVSQTSCNRTIEVFLGPLNFNHVYNFPILEKIKLLFKDILILDLASIVLFY